MDSTASIDLVAILGQVPPLLEQCVLDEVKTLRALRLVNKDASRIALHGLKSFHLSLKGADKESSVSCARMLSHAQLTQLSVSMTLSGWQLHLLSFAGLFHNHEIITSTKSPDENLSRKKALGRLCSGVVWSDCNMYLFLHWCRIWDCLIKNDRPNIQLFLMLSCREGLLITLFHHSHFVCPAVHHS